MVNPGAFKGSRKEFLLAQKPAYAEAVTGGFVADALADIQRRYFKRYPVDLSHETEPTEEHLAAVDDDEADPEPQHPNQEAMSENEYEVAIKAWEERTELIRYRKGQIKRWMAYQYMKDQDAGDHTGASSNPFFKNLVSQLSGKEGGRPRKKTAVNVWQKGQRQVIEEKVKHLAESQGISKDRYAALRDKIARELFGQLSAEAQEAWKKQAEEESKLASEDYDRSLNASPSIDPKDRQICIQRIVRTTQPILDALSQSTGWNFSLIAGGPEPADSGKLNIISVHAGLTPGDVKMNFGRSERSDYKKYIMPIFGRFLKKCFSPEECRSRALNAEGLVRLQADELESTGATLDGLEESDSGSGKDSMPTIQTQSNVPSRQPSVPAGSLASAPDEAAPSHDSVADSSTSTPLNTDSSSPDELRSSTSASAGQDSPVTSASAPTPAHSSSSTCIPDHRTDSADNEMDCRADFERLSPPVSAPGSPPVSPTRSASPLPPEGPFPHASPPPSPRASPPVTPPTSVSPLPSEAPLHSAPPLPPHASSPISPPTGVSPMLSEDHIFPPPSPRPSPPMTAPTSSRSSPAVPAFPSASPLPPHASPPASPPSIASLPEVSHPSVPMPQKPLDASSRQEQCSPSPSSTPLIPPTSICTRSSSRKRPPPLGSLTDSSLSKRPRLSRSSTPGSISTASSTTQVAVDGGADAPKWFKDALLMLQADDLGSEWVNLLECWTKFETQAGFKERGKLRAQNRPSCIGDWIQRKRSGTWRPTLGAVDMGKAFRKWWISLQPSWRLSEGGKIVRSATSGDWSCLCRPGLNGIHSVIVGLYFWGIAARKESVGEDRWARGVEDASHVLTVMHDRESATVG
ncbi:hypothetical protein CVT26_001499 [Gymnopilus dilepis]|uniref:Uncharacterized protein n=1 Tax=Gymnopilus dilepis TaxID=231916 RepID=A0A409WEH4_9AGAR|nr:hypothetical protein CVT26_001499 [Gymnopilus dilepis]